MPKDLLPPRRRASASCMTKLRLMKTANRLIKSRFMVNPVVRIKNGTGSGAAHGTALAMNRLDQHAHLVRIGELRNTVAEVEHVAGVVAVAVDDAGDLGADAVRGTVQRAGIEVALQGNLAVYAAAGLADVEGPVESERGGADPGHGFQPVAAALGEDDAGEATAFALLGQAGDDALHVGEREFLVRVRG